MGPNIFTFTLKDLFFFRGRVAGEKGVHNCLSSKENNLEKRHLTVTYTMKAGSQSNEEGRSFEQDP